MDSLFIAGTGAIITALYFFIGFGVSRMASKINGEDPRLFNMVAWPIIALIFAACGEVV